MATDGFPDQIELPDDALYTARFPMALAYAATKHAAHRRKDSAGTPYITHPVAVAGFVWQFGAEHPGPAAELEDLLIAALLHDVAEDAGGRAALEEIRALFGERVAQVVTAASDALPAPGEEKAPWRPRKERHLAVMARLARGDAESGLQPDPGACLVIGSDKLHNLAETAEAVARQGEGYLDRFTEPASVRWYYRAARDALAPGLPPAMLAELDRHLSRLGT